MMLSIVIPAREEERAIAETVRQFKNLAIPHEVIVSDGNSYDRTIETARSAGAHVVENRDGARFPARQRNRGAHIATGELLLFVDTTVLLPNIGPFIERALRHFEDRRIVALAVPQWIYPECASLSDRFFLSMTNRMLRLQKMGSGKFMLVRRSAYEKVGGFREELMTREDGDLFVRLKTQGEVVFDKELFILYAGRREHAWGWRKLLWVWLRDTISVVLFDRSMSKDWTPVR